MSTPFSIPQILNADCQLPYVATTTPQLISQHLPSRRSVHTRIVYIAHSRLHRYLSRLSQLYALTCPLAVFSFVLLSSPS